VKNRTPTGISRTRAIEKRNLTSWEFGGIGSGYGNSVFLAFRYVSRTIGVLEGSDKLARDAFVHSVKVSLRSSFFMHSS